MFYIDAQPHRPVLWQFPAGCLLSHTSWSHLKITQASMDVKQACQGGLSKSKLFNFGNSIHMNYWSFVISIKSYSGSEE